MAEISTETVDTTLATIAVALVWWSFFVWLDFSHEQPSHVVPVGIRLHVLE